MPDCRYGLLPVAYLRKQPLVQQPVAGHDRSMIHLCVRAVQPGDNASSLTNDEDPGGNVPRSQREFPERIQASAGQVAQVEGRRTEAAQCITGVSPHGG